ncbi:VPLPA-CTERM sorting domain-containing protein [Limimaricola litoreus]
MIFMKKNGLRNLAIAAVAIVTATSAQAIPVRWSFENVTSDPGGEIERWGGSFVFDQDIGSILEYDFYSAHHHFIGIQPFSVDTPFSDLDFYRIYFGSRKWLPAGMTRFYTDIELTFDFPLSNLGGAVGVSGFELNGFEYYNDPWTYTLWTHGVGGYIEGIPEPDWVSPVPLPASGILLLGAFGAMAAASRKRKTSAA